MDWQHLRGMALSLSHTPRVGDPRFAEFERALKEFFDRYEKNGAVTSDSVAG